MAVQSHSQVLPEQAGIWAQAVPVPHVQSVAGQPLDRASLCVWSVLGSGWELALVLTKERPVLRQLWLDNRFLESLGQLGNWLGLHQGKGHGQDRGGDHRPGHGRYLVGFGNERLGVGLVPGLVK